MAIENDVVATINVATANGSRFTGTFSFSAPNFDDSSIVNIQGNHVNGYTVNLARDLTSADIGEHNVTITATQDGSSLTLPFTFIVTGAPFGAHALRPSLYHNTDTFYRPTVVRGTRSLTPTRYVNIDTFYIPVVGAVANQTNTPFVRDRRRGPKNRSQYRYLLDRTGTPVGTAPQILTPNLYLNTDSFYVPDLTLAGSFSAPNAFFRKKRFVQRHKNESVGAPTFLPLTIAPSLFVETNTFYLPSVTLVGSFSAPNAFIRGKRFVQRHKNESVSAPVPLDVFVSDFYIEKRGRVTPRPREHSVGTPSALLPLSPLMPALFNNVDVFSTPTVSGGSVETTVPRIPFTIGRKKVARRRIDVTIGAPEPEPDFSAPNVVIKKQRSSKIRRYIHYRPYDDS